METLGLIDLAGFTAFGPALVSPLAIMLSATRERG